MTHIHTISPSKTLVRSARLLLVGASGLALSAPLAANQLLFTTSEARPETGVRTDQRAGLTQIALTGGGTVSIVDAAEYRLNADGSIDLYEGTITVAAGGAGEVVVRMPEGLEGRVAGVGSAGNFSVRETGEASGHALTGSVRIGRADRLESFAAGEMWRGRGAGGARRVIANDAQVQPNLGGGGDRNELLRAQPNSVVAIGGDAGPVAAAVNGIPTGFGDQLAGAGASSDIVAAARRIEAVVGNPALDTFPSGDLALLVSAAARLEGINGGTPFPQAQADIIRAYLRFLAGGGAGNDFLTAYSGFVVSYLDLIRAGGLPSGFANAGPDDIEAYLAYIRRTGALANLAARDRVLAEAYLSFLASGGNRDAFAASFTDLTVAYFAFVRGGGDPAAFTGASQAALAQTIAFLRDSGLVVQLSAADRALVEAFLANGGLAFAAQYETALGDYFAFLASGRLPSEYAALDQATLRAYLETLSNTGLLASVLGDQAGFYADYLAFLRAGGQIDAFAGLPANIFAGYTVQLDAYFAFLATGRLPSEFSGTDIAVLQAYLLELQQAGALERFLGDRAAFFAQFAAFVAAGGTFDGFGGLPANIFAGYAIQLDSYFAFLASGRLPSEFSGTDIALLQAYLLELQQAGALERFLGDRAAFFAQFAAFVAGGGTFDTFGGLPANIFAGYAVQLEAYFTFLASGRLPSEFSGTDLAVLQAYLLELQAAGALERFLGERASFFAAFAAFVADGGTFDGFAGLPANVFAGYAVDLRAFFAFIEAGGVPSAYTLLTAEQIRDYIAALEAAGATGSFLGDLAAFYREYAVYLAGGGNPDLFAGLPVPPDFPAFAAALNAYAAFLQAGGLPSAYTAEDLARLRSFIDALNRSGQLASLLGANADLLTRYFAFIAGGGAPDGFVGLPVYVQYIDALNAYFTFLQGGGLPSGYGELDAATIEAYLAALAALQGGLAAIEGLDPFFVDYFIFIAGGGDPDVFAGLPVNGGGGNGGGNPGGVSTQLAGVNAWVFGPDALRINTAADVTVDADGRITSVTLNSPAGNQTFNFDANSPNLREFGRIGDAVAWSRYAIGQFGNQPNVSQHIMVGTPATNLPGTGTVSYRLVGGTAPTNRNVADEATGWFTGNLAVQFGAAPLVGIDFEVFSRTEGYRVSTQGGAANPGLGGMGIRSDGTFENQNLAITRLTDTTCLGFCQAQVFGGAFGDEAEAVGFTYNVFDQRAGNAINGIAIFGQAGDALAGLGTPPAGGGGTTTRSNQNLAFANLYVGDDAVSGGSVTVDDQGRIVGYQSRAREIFTQGTTAIAESGTAAGVTWTRWANGTPGGDYYGTTAFDPIGINGGWHVIAGDALSNIPTSGTIAYNLVGSTTPTRSGEGSSTGSITGSAAVQFGTTARFGLDLTVTSGADQIRMATDGGVTDVSRSRLTINSAGVFSSGVSNPEVTTTNLAGNFCATGCLSFVQGFLSGDGASGAGLSYAIRQEGVTPQGFINGTAAFERGSAIGGGGTAMADGVVPTGGVDSPFAFAGPGSVGEVSSAATMTVTDGVLRQARRGSIRVEYTPTANSTIEVSGDQGVIGWQRINAVSTVYSGGTGQVFQSNPFVEQFWHSIWGAPLVNLPTSGLINYEFIGGSTAHQLNARPGDGTFEGRFSVDFVTLRAGLEATVTLDGPDAAIYDFASAGGVAAPSMQLTDDGFGSARFSEILPTTQRGVGAVSRGTTVAGFLAGDGATHAGLTYAIRTSSSNRIVGTAAFRATATSTTTSTAGMTTARAGVPVPATATAAAPVAPVADWSRWSGGVPPTGRLPVEGGNRSGIGIVPPGLAGLEGVADPADRSAVIRQAEQLMGGMITFRGSAPEPR
jgi:hypothetical protein